MGYEVHLVRTGNWFDETNVFTQVEWDHLCRLYAVGDWLWFGNGNISVKNPTPTQIVELVNIAQEFGWRVQGDDGEFYAPDGTPMPDKPFPRQKPGFWQKLTDLWGKNKAGQEQAINDPFHIGDRVRFLHRRGGVVIDVNPKANHGLGSIKARFPDGVVIGATFLNHGFEKEDAS